MTKRDHLPGKLKPISLKGLPNGWHADGGNLYLFVRGNSRNWIFRYVAPDGTRRNMSLGPLRGLTLARARDVARELVIKVKDPVNPIDPMREAQSKRQEEKATEEFKRTFKQCADAFIESKRHGWKNAKHASQWEATLNTYVYPKIGSMAVNEIDTPHIVSVLEPIWHVKSETASRVRSRMENIISWATVSKFREGENPARWRGHLDHIFPPVRKVTAVKHHPALPYHRLPEFITILRKRAGMGARALEFTILTAARSGEVRGATWDEINLNQGTWTIPGSRMKTGKEHRVPLTDAAIELLQALPRVAKNPLVFPGSKNGAPMSDMSLTAVLRRIGEQEITVHGFRSTFRDWSAEQTTYPREACELCLAHTVGDAVERAYRRGDLFDLRKQLMADWASFCSSSNRDINCTHRKN
ncbi:integrase [Kineobactrum sediminis]|uniref:Integrase n=1 Tax=Kineobactrum sediminis TaxID=1905677 RepID=A0A2N5Y2C1_9GAMM|nr:site-specific integrase [Kineobactrum sediminis]PLW82519.1 integrase [Kineobactrum sediminis]